MNTNTVNISFQKDLLKKIDKVAKDESRTRSELIREAARMYIDKKNKWKEIFEFGDSIQKINNLSESDIMNEIKSVRK
ncbi:MAG TPA: ribbon-helix-helix domain-containing protein [Spirochaetota bacterium]|jgi:metal-responsive CopG/Arc/MetJ family transcriptional regulator|nr:ribbon-helix-helix domain-containing protein [Spirochaetota bacterium]HPJ16207.1 ribbon-helix-helix domain-containing protein [Spirochaetota bacterium]